MTGAMLLLSLGAAAELAIQRSVIAFRGFIFISLTGTSAVLMCGLPQMLAPSLGAQWLLPLKAALAPLASAVALYYLGLWVGLVREDRLVRWIMLYGCAAVLVAAIAVVSLALHATALDDIQLIALSGCVTSIAVVFGAVIALRSATLGDELSRWMSLACVFMAAMVSGLYAKALDMQGAGIDGTGLPVWVLTAVATVIYFLMSIGLTTARNRELRRLNRMASTGRADDETALGLPRGGQLIAKVDDALWRSARVKRDCLVAAINVANLYEPDWVAGPSVQPQILVSLAARIRRSVGFRNVVGLYHARCFILVISAVQDPRRDTLLTTRLLNTLRLPIRLDRGRHVHTFGPHIGIGVVRLAGSGHDALRVINKAEHLAIAASQAGGMLAVHWDGVQAPDSEQAPAVDDTATDSTGAPGELSP